MKQYLLLISTVLLLAACSSKQYAFRQTVNAPPRTFAPTTKANKQHVAIIPQRLIHTTVIPPSYAIYKSTQTSNTNLVTQTTKYSKLKLAKPYQIENDSTRRKKYKFDDESTKASKEKPDNFGKTNIPPNRYDVYAILGFVFALTGILLYALPIIPGFILSIMGLKSKRYKGLAIAGLIISAIVIFLILLIITLFIIAISTYR